MNEAPKFGALGTAKAFAELVIELLFTSCGQYAENIEQFTKVNWYSGFL